MKKKLVVATNNAHKLEEIATILGNAMELLSLKDIQCFADIPETADTLEGNARQKAQYIYTNYGLDCFDVTEILRFALNDKTEKKFLLLINFQVRYLALEVSGLFEREYQGADIADACLAFLVHPAFLNVQFFHLLAVDEEAGSLVVTFDGNLHALARLNIIGKGI